MHGGSASYYQGLHDIAAVLLFVTGPMPAYAMLRQLVSCHLRDCTRYLDASCPSHCIFSIYTRGNGTVQVLENSLIKRQPLSLELIQFQEATGGPPECRAPSSHSLLHQHNLLSMQSKC